ncbi:MAG TPA: sulfurtransferase-like selenium metabolism protein YedF [Victivallales bacterium]|nr:sulfurtransferase-like selenium metabolism protein YedF [Victivallales bacterium]
MENKIIDARGKECPIPLIMTRKALKENINSSFLLLIDNEIAKENVQRFLTDNNIEFRLHENGDVYHFSVNAGESEFVITRENISDQENTINKKDDYVICIKSLTMGTGPEDLGKILLKAFINTLIESENLPSHIILYNSGVILATTDSSVIGSLRKLSKLGIKIIVCGACVEYFEVKRKLDVGIISNMFDIIDILSNADKVVYP